MAELTIYEKGDSLEALALKARVWFDTNGVEVPSGAKMWQQCSVRRGEIPPGTGVTSLRRYGFNVTALISCITNNPDLKAYRRDPLTADNIKALGFELLDTKSVKGHKKLLTKCLCCGTEEELDYGTLQRMKDTGNTFCRVCRNAGGKEKSLDTYDKFIGFDPVSKDDGRVTYKCVKCSGMVERTFSHIHTSEYIVCEHCYPKVNFGARHYTDLGYFDSKFEYEAYKTLLKYLDKSLVIRQKKYDELFNTGTKHTADFYIPTLDIILEVTTSSNNIGEKYQETATWKMSLSPKVKFAYSLHEVEDIVRPLVKAKGLNVDHSGDVLCSGT